MDAEFEKWQAAWDKAAVKFAKESADKLANTPSHPQTSWFTNSPSDQNYKMTDTVADPAWRDIFFKTQERDGLITDSVKLDNGPEKPKQNFGAFTPTKTNPTDQHSTGTDQETEDGGVRVTKHWIDSEELRELDDIKRRLEGMERKHHEAEVREEKSSGLKKELQTLRERVKKLSEKINREPEVDVT